MPCIGYGTGGRTSKQHQHRYDGVRLALANGIRHIDTAVVYKDEEDVGRAIRDSGVPREEVWITSKLDSWSDGASTYDETLAQLTASLERLGTPYLDLYLIHSPCDRTNRVEQWRALLDARASGLIRAAGVSNYAVRHLEELRNLGLELPSVNQLEFNPWIAPIAAETAEYCKAHGIVLEAFAPLGPLQEWKEPASSPALSTAATSHRRASVSQVLLRWLIQRGVVPVFGTDNERHMRENLGIFDFELTPDEMAAINATGAARPQSAYGKFGLSFAPLPAGQNAEGGLSC